MVDKWLRDRVMSSIKIRIWGKDPGVKDEKGDWGLNRCGG